MRDTFHVSHFWEKMTPGFPTYLLDGETFHPALGLPLTDRGFRYGMSVFETVALRDSAPLLLEPHLARLAESAAAAGFDPPASWLPASRALLSRPPIPEGLARLYLTAGDHDDAPSRVALLFETLLLPAALSHARAATVEFTPALPFGKTGNYWPHLRARPANGDEAILCTPDGRLLGGAMSNLFLLFDETVFTPAHPIRRGVVRQWLGASERELTRADLATAGAAFLTNSRFGVRELTAIDGRPLPGDPQVRRIWQRYRTEVLRAG